MRKALPNTDPTAGPSYENPGPIDRFFLSLINDPRDLAFVHLSVQAAVLFPFAIYLFLPGRFSWWLAALYLVVNVFGFMDRFILMLHNTSHRVLYKKQYRVLNYYIPWILGPFCGETPDTYYAHHMGMHHPENNLYTDLSSTMRYRRDSFLGWLHYYLRFLFLCVIELALYHRARKHGRLIQRMLTGELGFYALTAGLLAWSWRPALVVCVIPFMIARTVMMMGNWGQHAFVDAKTPESPHRNSITVVNCRYNRRCFNDGYHIGHHVKANRHWTEMATDFEKNREQYAREGAIVFEGIDFLGVWFCLMLKRYDWLADRYVQLGETEKSRDEIIALLKERVQPILDWQQGPAPEDAPPVAA